MNNKRMTGLIENELGSKVSSFERVYGGINNISLKCILENNKTYFVKKYVRDERLRLEREYSLFTFLHKKGLFKVPKPFFYDKDGYFAVYEFIKGEVKRIESVNLSEMKDLALYASKLHSILPTDVNRKLVSEDAVLPVFSLSDHVDNMNFKLGRFNSYFRTLPDSSWIKKILVKEKIKTRINFLLKSTLKDIPMSDLRKRIGSDKLRINHIDFGFHNVIYKKTTPYFIDYELSGWDDPFRMIGDFMTHHKSLEISKKFKRIFLEKYIEFGKLDSLQEQRLLRTIKLMDIEWIATYLWSFTPEKISFRKESIKEFDRKKYTLEQIDKTKTRILQLEEKQ